MADCTIGQIKSKGTAANEKNRIADKLWASGVVGNDVFSKQRLKAKKAEYERTGNRQGYDVASALLYKISNPFARTTTKPVITSPDLGNIFDSSGLYYS